MQRCHSAWSMHRCGSARPESFISPLSNLANTSSSLLYTDLVMISTCAGNPSSRRRYAARSTGAPRAASAGDRSTFAHSWTRSPLYARAHPWAFSRLSSMILLAWTVLLHLTFASSVRLKGL